MPINLHTMLILTTEMSALTCESFPKHILKRALFAELKTKSNISLDEQKNMLARAFTKHMMVKAHITLREPPPCEKMQPAADLSRSRAGSAAGRARRSSLLRSREGERVKQIVPSAAFLCYVHVYMSHYCLALCPTLKT